MNNYFAIYNYIIIIMLKLIIILYNYIRRDNTGCVSNGINLSCYNYSYYNCTYIIL